MAYESFFSFSSSSSFYASYSSSSSSGAIVAPTNPSRVYSNATETLRLPLTTIFTPPSRCSQIPYTFSTQASGLSTFWRNSNGPGEGANAACYPHGFRLMNRSTVNAEYSPGVCPHGYTAASSAEDTSRGAWTSWCCPLGMNYAQGYGCYTTVSTPTEVMLNSVTSTTKVDPFIAADWYVQVAWATSDLTKFSPKGAPLWAPNTGIPTPATSALPGVPNAGMMVGIPISLVTTAVLAVACYALWRRKRRRTREASLLESIREDEKAWNTDMEYQRYDSAQIHTSSEDTPTTNTDNSPIVNDRQHYYATVPHDNWQDTPTTNTDNSPIVYDRQNYYTTARHDNWRDSLQFDETQPVTEPR